MMLFYFYSELIVNILKMHSIIYLKIKIENLGKNNYKN